MKLLGLEIPLPSNHAAMHDVLAAAAATLGFGLGSWLLDTPLDRTGAVALFIGLLYIMLVNPFLARKDARGKRYALAGTGAGILIACGAVMERFAAF
jgi:membrane protein implicated in regulation of membrane protease activity